MSKIVLAALVGLCFGLCAPLCAMAQPGVSIPTGVAPSATQMGAGEPQSNVSASLIGRDTGTGLFCVLGSTPTCALGSADANNAPYLGERPLTVGTPDPIGPGRAVKANCTSTGAVSVTYSDGSTGSWMVMATGTQIFGAEIVQINAGGTTATCSFGNMR